MLIKADLDDILCVCSVINWIFLNHGVLDADGEGDLEEVGASVSVVFVTSLHVVDEHFRREKHSAEFALHRLGVFEHSLEDLNRSHLRLECLVACFYLSNSF